MNGTEYTYFLTNASLALRVMEYLQKQTLLGVKFVTAIHQIDGWAIKIKLAAALDRQQDGNLRAFLIELGIPYQPDTRMAMALWSLELGASPLDVMRRYQVAVVSHGTPEKKDIEAFRQQFTKGLGYCPETLA
ncbi:hypothetical protein [Merismopedia glauca]|uniref:Uncharacterized protein n=1 Tax=Merismopedia glauca CCAP 1448/3 TaxID=1296344 RepID=A0A2T1C5Z4_9CYAN|nr:hypothetical protein [Merismopedia glauca]PSB03568.1 hypothetical protein C7B64_07920 [Merismopedia glauca CCAP 1448/3]